MIDRSQLAEALGRLDPRDREILDCSLHRRVPDRDLGETFGGSTEDVARLRAAAVGRLSEEMGVQRANDLGDMLKALLEPATWDLLASFAPSSAEGVGVPTHSEQDLDEHSAGGVEETDRSSTHLEQVAEERSRHGVEVSEQSSTPSEQDPGERLVRGAEDAEEAPAGGAGRRLAIGLAAAVALLGPPALVVAALNAHGNVEGDVSAGAASDARTFKPQPHATGGAVSSGANGANRYPTVHVRGRTALRDRPGGKVKVRIADRTEFDSPRVLGVVEQRGDWLAVLVPELKNGEVGWIEADAVDRFETLAISMHVDLSERKLVVRRAGKAVRRMKIGVGRSTNPTPKGRYAVTDKLRVSDPGSPYDCCALALTGHQTNLPEGWPGGDRLAVHATRDTTGLGKAVSLGCMRADPGDARWMMSAIPLGAPVFVRA